MIFTYNDAVGHDAFGHDAAADDDGGGDGDGDGESAQLLKKGTFLLLSLLSSFFFFSTTNKTELTQDKMQPPPRKVKHASALKVIHTEQLQKLQSKHQQEVELLEDIRVFSQKRSAIEKEYAQSLLKLTSSLLKKDIAIPPDIPREDGKNHKTAIIVWRQILEELEKVGKARLAASEIYYEKCAEPAKPLKNAKVQCLKKLVNQLSLIQSEVSQSVLEMTKAHKIYVADETQTSEARQKATEADEKLKRKSVGFFKSMTSLQRNCAKLSSRYEQCAIKSTSSRNDYLLAQSAANAHQIRYYSVDLPELMKALDGEVYEKIQEYFTIHTATSAEVSAIETNCFQKLSLEAEKISRNYNLQCFLHDSNVFTELLQYQFEPCCNDQVSKLSKDHGAEHQLEKEAKKWSSKISKESKVIREQNKALRSHQTTSKPDQGGGTSAEKIESQDPETLFEEIKQSIRRAETAKMKAEARIELLRTCGVNVDDYLSCVDSLGAEPDNISRTPSQASLRTESSGGPTEEPEPTYTHFDDDDDDYAEDIPDVTEPTPISPTATQNSSSSRQYPIQAQALYTFQATNPDELGMEENEDIEVIGDGDGDGWVQAKDSRGNVGFIPESYIRVLDQSGSTQPAAESIDSYDIPATAVDMSQASSAPHGALSTPDLPPAPDIPPATDMSAEDLETPTGQETEMPPPPDFTVTNHIEPPTEPTHYDVASSFSSGDLEVQQATAQNATEPTLQNLPLVPNDGEVWARALYDYEANTDDELSFTEGTLIRIVRKDETGIDDGFWQGEIDGQFGVFPSLVVEELIENGEPKQDLLTPVKGGPPDFVPPPPVMVTLPTPDRITPPFLSNGQASSSASAAESSTDSSQKQPALDSQQPTVDAVGPGNDSQVPAGSEVPVESTVVTEEKQSIDEVEGSADKITGLQDQTEEDKKETSKYSEDKTGSLDHSGSIDQKNASEQTQSQEQAGSLDKTDSIDKNFSEHSESFDQTGSLDQTGSIDDDGNEAQDKKKQEAPLISEVSNTKEEEEEKLETVTEEATTTSTTTSATTTTTKTEQDGSEAISDQKPVVKSEEKVEKEEKTEEKKVEEEEEKEEKEEEDNELEVLL